LFISSGSAVLQDGVVDRERRAARKRVDETLNEDSVDLVLAHPLEVPKHGRAARGAEHLRARAVGVDEIGREAFVGGKLTQVGPHIDPHIFGSGTRPAAAPVVVATSGAVALGVEPALVAAHDFAGERRRIDARVVGSVECADRDGQK